MFRFVPDIWPLVGLAGQGCEGASEAIAR